MSTKLNQVHLAVHQTDPRPDPRMALRRMRVALAEVITQAPTSMADAWYDVSRKEPRAALPCAKERAMIHAAIADGCATPESVIRYRLFQMHDDLTQFGEAPLLEELLYVQMIQEQAEAIDAQSRAHALGTTTLELQAIRETEEATVLQRAYCAMKRASRSFLQASH